MDQTEGITCINVSLSKKFLVICERAARAVWTVYEIQHQKVRRSLLKGDQESTQLYQSKEFLAVQFSPKNEKHHLLTLTGEPDYNVILWKWDSSRIQAMISIGYQTPQGVLPTSLPFQISFNPFEENSVFVTGPNTYKYLKASEAEFTIDHSQLNNIDRNYGYDFSSFQCHAWMADSARLIVCTERGDIVVCENSGEFYCYVERDDRQREHRIKAIVPYNRGFVIGWSSGIFQAFERYDDPNNGNQTFRRCL
jgi:hypothetical protein